MRTIVQDGARNPQGGTKSSSQFWGIVCTQQHVANMRERVATQLRDRHDIRWNAGMNWCLVHEGGEGNAIADSLASCDKSGLHAAIAGKAWPLNGVGHEDACLVLDLYRLYGEEIVTHCDGQFAAAVVDERNSRVTLSTSWPGGFHQLFYCTDTVSVCFATRIDLLIQRCGWQARANEQAIVDLLRFGGLVDEETLLAGIHRVIPGSVVVCESTRTERHIVDRGPPTEDYGHCDIEEVASLHREAVRRRISGCGGFGLFLSGGLDSGLNVAVAAELSDRPVKTFSAAFDAAEFDESSYAHLVATKYKTEHSEVHLKTEGCLDRLPEMVWAMQEPIIDYSYVPTFIVAEAMKQHVDVAIGGDGPDHLLGRNYQYAAWYNLLSRIPFALGAATWSVAVGARHAKVRHGLWRYARRRRRGRQLWQALACVHPPCGSGMLNSFCNDLWGDLPPGDIVRLLSPSLQERTNIEPFNHAWTERWRMEHECSSQNRYILADASLSGMCGVFAKVGAMCSAHNVTLYEPYLSRPLVQCFCRIEDSWKVNGSWGRRLTRTISTSETKRVLRRIAMDYLPEEIVFQKQKHGFEFPLVQCWQQATAGVSTRCLFGALLSRTDWLDYEYVDRLVREQAADTRNHRYMLLLLAALDQWFRIFLQGGGQRPTWKWSDSF